MTEEELAKAADAQEKRLLEEGDPFSGDDYEMMQLVRWTKKLMAERDALKSLLVKSDKSVLKSKPGALCFVG